MLLEGGLSEVGVLPEVGGEEGVGLPEGEEHGLDEVTGGPGVAARGGVAVLDSGEGEDLFSDGGGDEAGSAGGGDEADADGAALSVDLGGDGVGHAVHAAPVSAADGDDVELGDDDGATDGVGNLTGALDSKANVSLVVTDGNKGLEAGPLSGRGLLLDGHDPHDLVVELSSEEVVDNLGLLDGDGVKENLLDGVDPSVLDKASELGDGGPDLLVPVPAVSASTSASSTATSPSKSSTFSFSRHIIKLF